MLPQIYNNVFYSFREDVQAFGVLMYFMLNMQFPFSLNSHFTIQQKKKLSKKLKGFYTPIIALFTLITKISQISFHLLLIPGQNFKKKQYELEVLKGVKNIIPQQQNNISEEEKLIVEYENYFSIYLTILREKIMGRQLQKILSRSVRKTCKMTVRISCKLFLQIMKNE